MRRWKFFLVAAATLGTVALTGCQKDLSKEEVDQIEVFNIGEEKVYLNEVWIYAKTIEQEYEKNYGSGIWAVELQNGSGDNETVETITKEDVINEIVQVKVLNYEADTYGVALTNDEITTAELQANDFVNGLTDAQQSETGIDFDTALKVYEENAIAQKVYDRIMEEGSIEVSDEECRQTKIYDLYFPTYIEQSDGSFVALSDEEKETQLKTANEAYQKIVDESEPLSIENAAYEYGSSNSGFYTMSEDEFVEQYGQEITDQIYAAKDGDYIGVVESEYGYHIFQVISLTDAEATQAKKNEMKVEKQRKYFNETFDKYLKEMDSSWKFSKNVDEDAWNMITFTDTNASFENTEGTSSESKTSSESTTGSESDTSSESDTDSEAGTASSTTADDAN